MNWKMIAGFFSVVDLICWNVFCLFLFNISDKIGEPFITAHRRFRQFLIIWVRTTIATGGAHIPRLVLKQFWRNKRLMQILILWQHWRHYTGWLVLFQILSEPAHSFKSTIAEKSQNFPHITECFNVAARLKCTNVLDFRNLQPSHRHINSFMS